MLTEEEMRDEAAGAGHPAVTREDNDRPEADSPVDENDNDASPPRKKRKSNTNRPTTAKEKDEGEKDGFKYCIYDGCHYHSLSQEITLRHIDVCPKMPTKVSTAKGMVTLPLRLTNPPPSFTYHSAFRSEPSLDGQIRRL